MISVIIPTYNRATMLSQALASLSGQGDFEVVVIDDGSTDQTKEIVNGFKERLNLKYVYQNHRGLSAAKNRGIAAATGEIVAFFDDDAIADADWLKNIETAMARESIVTGRVEPIHNNIWKYFAPHYNQGEEERETNILVEGNSAVQKRVFADIGQFNEGLTYGHEGREWLERAGRKYRVKYLPQMVIRHDYASGLSNYLAKQFKFGHKMVYLNQEKIKSWWDLIYRYPRLKTGEAGATGDKIKLIPTFTEKILIAIIARAGNVSHFFGALVGYWGKTKKQ